MSFLAVVKILTAADAEQLAAKGNTVRRDQRSRRNTNNFLPEEASAQDLEVLETLSNAKSLVET